MSKTKAFLDAGGSNILSYISGQASIVPVIDNTVKKDAVSAGISVAQTAGSAAEMMGKTLPGITIGGKLIPLTSLGLAGIGLLNDINTMQKQYNLNSTIPTSSLLSALSNISSAGSALGLAAATASAAAGTAAAAPLVGVAAVLTLLGAGLAVASVAADDSASINPSSIINNLRESFQQFGEWFGETYNEALDWLKDKLGGEDEGDEADEGRPQDAPGAGDSPLPGEGAPGEPGKPSSPERGAAGGVAEKAGKGMGEAADVTSPLILDLDGDGVETANNELFFDHDGNGFAELSGWVGKDDGLLALDKNANGQIDDGNELFGNNSLTESGTRAANGFAALAEYDLNGDGVIDEHDAVFEKLRVWRDANGNGATDPGELLSLETAGVKSINLEFSNINNTDEQGNRHLQQGSFTRTDGSIAKVVDVWFKANLTRTLDKNEVDVTDEIARLPDVVGAGNMSDLRQAMARSTDGVLQQLVEQFVQMADQQGRYTLADEILRVWSGAKHYATDSRGSYIDGQQVYALEAFVGKGFSQRGDANPLRRAAEKLEETYKLVLDNVYGQLMLQSHLSDLMDNLSVRVEDQRLVWDVSDLISALRTDYSKDPEKAVETLVELGQALISVDSEYSLAVLKALASSGNRAGDDLDIALSAFGEQVKVSIGGYGDDTLSATADTAQALYGLSGDDKLYGGRGGDSLRGGKGDDVLSGRNGDDRYYYAQGDGDDTIVEEGIRSGDDDRLVLEGINDEQVSLSRDGIDMILHIAERVDGAGDGGSIRLKQQFDWSHQRGVDRVEFADGTVWTQQMMREQLITNSQTAGDDRVTGSNAADTLRGGTGDDYLDGRSGNDHYYYARGDGDDTIVENNVWSGINDRLLLEDINADQVNLSRDGIDVILHIADGAGDGGSIRLKQQFDWRYQRGVENVEFADGTVWTAQTLRGLTIASMETAGDDRVTGSNVADTLRGGTGDDYLEGRGGDDRYYYARGDGRDTIQEDAWSSKDDQLLLDDINADQVSLSRDDGDVILHIADGAGDGGSIRLKQQFDWRYQRGVEHVEFADGTVWTQQMMRDLTIASMQTAGDDRVIGSNLADTLRGGTGDDALIGRNGNDSYYYARGDGHDTIVEEDNWCGEDDRLVLEDIDIDQVSLSRDGGDMILHIAESAKGVDDGGSLRLKSQFDQHYERGIENVEFADGTVWTQQSMLEWLAAEEQKAQKAQAAEIDASGADGEVMLVGANTLAEQQPELAYL